MVSYDYPASITGSCWPAIFKLVGHASPQDVFSPVASPYERKKNHGRRCGGQRFPPNAYGALCGHAPSGKWSLDSPMTNISSGTCGVSSGPCTSDETTAGVIRP